MISPALSLTEAQTIQALGNFLTDIMSAGMPILRAQINRVPEPASTDFITMTPILRERLEWNTDTYGNDVEVITLSGVNVAPNIGDILVNQDSSAQGTVLSLDPTSTISFAAMANIPSVGDVLVNQDSSARGIVTGISGLNIEVTQGLGYYFAVGDVISDVLSFENDNGDAIQFINGGGDNIDFVSTSSSVGTITAIIGLTVTLVPLGLTYYFSVGDVLTDLNPSVRDNIDFINNNGDSLQFTNNSGDGIDFIPNTVLVGTISAVSYGSKSILSPTKVTVQLDIHGPNSADNAAIVSGLFFDAFASDQFSTSGFAVYPLYSTDPKQVPFFNGEQQVEERWVVDVVMQTNPVITAPVQYGTSFAGNVINVAAAYPPT